MLPMSPDRTRCRANPRLQRPAAAGDAYGRASRHARFQPRRPLSRHVVRRSGGGPSVKRRALLLAFVLGVAIGVAGILFLDMRMSAKYSRVLNLDLLVEEMRVA